jgi:DnaJ-class molecular chaperone
VIGRSFGFTLTYRPIGPGLVSEPDERPTEGLPRCQYSTRASAAERERYLTESCRDLETQGYRIERVERWSRCARCEGAGIVVPALKGKRRPRLLKRIPCPSCGGSGAEELEQAS